MYAVQVLRMLKLLFTYVDKDRNVWQVEWLGFSFIGEKAIVCHTKQKGSLRDKFNDLPSPLFYSLSLTTTSNSYHSLSLSLSSAHTRTHYLFLTLQHTRTFDIRFIFLSCKCRNATTRCIYEVQSIRSPQCRQQCVW